MNGQFVYEAKVDVSAAHMLMVERILHVPTLAGGGTHFFLAT